MWYVTVTNAGESGFTFSAALIRAGAFGSEAGISETAATSHGYDEVCFHFSIECAIAAVSEYGAGGFE